MKRDTLMVIAAGAVVGLLAVILAKLGNPANMGFCIACFERDIAGALGLFNWSAGPKYLRPEIIGIVLGAFFTAVAFREFKPTGGSAPLVRFMLGLFMMIGALAFLGCPLRMMIRLGGGDLNALVALVGFVAGILVGVALLRSGYNLGRTRKMGSWDGFILPGFMVLLLAFLVFRVRFIEGGPLLLQAKGYPGAEGTLVNIGVGVLVSLVAGLLVGFFAQRSRMCFAGGFRDLFLMRSWHLLSAIIAVFVVVLIGGLVMGTFHLGFAEQPVSHSAHLWNFFGMALVGIAATLLGGCPLRQLVLSSNGNTDSVVAVAGMFAGAAFAHNFGLAGVPNSGVSAWGQAAVVLGLVLAIVYGLINLRRS